MEKTVFLRVESNVDELLKKIEKIKAMLEEAKTLADELASGKLSLKFEIKS